MLSSKNSVYAHCFMPTKRFILLVILLDLIDNSLSITSLIFVIVTAVCRLMNGLEAYEKRKADKLPPKHISGLKRLISQGSFVTGSGLPDFDSLLGIFFP